MTDFPIREPIVRERTIIRVFRSTRFGRCIDLEFRFTALQDGVTIARRDTELYGGLNLRMAENRNQQITFHTDPESHRSRMAWGDLFGVFGDHQAGLTVLQQADNPDYPGDWIKYPELNWFQPTFPAAKHRFALRKGEPLVLRFRLWIRRDVLKLEEFCSDLWLAYHARP